MGWKCTVIPEGSSVARKEIIMKIAVRYHSRSGNTKKVADVIAQTVDVQAQTCTVSVDESVDLLFLGGSVYGFGLDEVTKNFIANLSPEYVKCVALFGTSAMVKTGNREMAKLLKEKGIAVAAQDFHCRGAFAFMHRGHPNQEDLERAAIFARLAQKEG